MLLKKEEFWTRIERGQIDPAYFFCGQEAFFIREAVRKIETSFLGPNANPFQSHHLYGDDVGIEELIELARTLPFGKTRRFITYQLMGRLKTSDMKLMTSYMDHIPKDTVLILTSEEMDLSQSLMKLFKEKGVIVRFYPLFKNQVPGWIRAYATQIGIQMAHDAAQLLEELVGSDPSLLSNELQKIALYFQPKKKIDMKDVEEVVGKIRIFSIFELTKNLGERKAAKSLRILQQLIDAGQSPVGIIALIANHFRRLYWIKELLAQGKSQGEIARTVNLPPTFLKESVEQAGLFNQEEISRIFNLFLETDLQLKSSVLSQELILGSLIFNICNVSFPLALS